jgi:hypothetical protein
MLTANKLPEPTRVEQHSGAPDLGKHLTLPANFRLVLSGLFAINLGDKEKKSFTNSTPGPNVKKLLCS